MRKNDCESKYAFVAFPSPFSFPHFSFFFFPFFFSPPLLLTLYFFFFPTSKPLFWNRISPLLSLLLSFSFSFFFFSYRVREQNMVTDDMHIWGP